MTGLHSWFGFRTRKIQWWSDDALTTCTKVISSSKRWKIRFPSSGEVLKFQSLLQNLASMGADGQIPGMSMVLDVKSTRV